MTLIKMREKFRNWIIKKGNKQSTAMNYAIGIYQISKNYSEKMGENIDIYKITDLCILKNIAKEYGTEGKYSDFGNLRTRRMTDTVFRYLLIKERRNI
jgi:hypothetical protein